MPALTLALTLFIAVEHFGFAILESFLWTKPFGRRVFRQSEAQARASASLAMNQGLYNAFLGAGLIWAALQSEAHFAAQLRVFFFSCVLLAGLVGALTVNRRILLVQGLPALVALVLELLK